MFRDDTNQILKGLKQSPLRQFDQEVSQIPGIVKLTLGEPNFSTPAHIKMAAISAIAANESHYTPIAGLPELREAAANYYNQKFNLNYTAENTLVTVGATEGVSASFQALLQPGDSVIVPTPIYPLYLPLIKLQHATPILVDTSADDFVLTPERLQTVLDQHRQDHVKAIVLNAPSNPTGIAYTRSEMQALAAILKQEQLWVLSDEIYAELTYGQKHTSMGELLPEQTIVINGLSKSHAMTGWRLGFAFAPKDLMAEMLKAHQYMVTMPTTFVQYAAIEAMKHGQNDCAPMVKIYQRRRDYVREHLQQLGFEVARPNGAFYVFAKIPASFKGDSWEFARQLAYDQKVAVIAGAAFGPGGERYIRISYAASDEALAQACRGIAKLMQQTQQQPLTEAL